MDSEERRETLRALLREEIAEGKARIAERQAAREADPIAMNDFIMADAEPIGGAPVQREAPAGDLVYKRNEDALATPAEPDSEAAEQDWQEIVAQAIGEVVLHERARERKERAYDVAVLMDRISELTGKVDALLTIIGKSGDA